MLSMCLEIADVGVIFVSLVNPCKPNCPKRFQACHSTCKEYADYRKALDERNKKIRQARSVNTMLDEYVVNDVMKKKRAKGKR